MSGRARWDLFCRVVDNFGDIGIAWRLARQLAGASRDVRLVVDDLDAFATIEPRVDAMADEQIIEAIVIARWPGADVHASSVVVELLGCGLPAVYLDAMERAEPKACWIDFEHLSAEPWVDGFHARPSPHPTRPLVKHFFYPGFTERTGGLLVEPGLDERRAAFVADAAAVAEFRRAVGIVDDDTTTRMSLFAYPHAPIAGLLDALAADAARRWCVIVAGSGPADAIDRWFGCAGTTRTRGSLTVTTIGFLDQAGYDRLLWTCDVNVVRGEDSFVRAQAAGRPLVWHIYPQADDAHRRKLSAFEDLYETAIDPKARAAQRAFWDTWNDPRGDVAAVASDWLAALPRLAVAADAWRLKVTSGTPLVERLVAFVAERQASP